MFFCHSLNAIPMWTPSKADLWREWPQGSNHKHHLLLSTCCSVMTIRSSVSWFASTLLLFDSFLHVCHSCFSDCFSPPFSSSFSAGFFVLRCSIWFRIPCLLHRDARRLAHRILMGASTQGDAVTHVLINQLTSFWSCSAHLSINKGLHHMDASFLRDKSCSRFCLVGDE